MYHGKVVVSGGKYQGALILVYDVKHMVNIYTKHSKVWSVFFFFSKK